MNRSFCFVSLILIVTGFLTAQDQQGEGSRRHDPLEVNVNSERGEPRRRILTLDIDARVLDDEHDVVWSESHQKIAIPGTPVGIQLVGSNLVVAVQFTPFIRRHGSVLVAQVQIGIKDSEHGIRYYTSIQTIPIEFGEPVYFFPLGQSNETSSIEIILTLNTQRDNTADETIINDD